MPDTSISAQKSWMLFELNSCWLLSASSMPLSSTTSARQWIHVNSNNSRARILPSGRVTGCCTTVKPTSLIAIKYGGIFKQGLVNVGSARKETMTFLWEPSIRSKNSLWKVEVLLSLWQFHKWVALDINTFFY